MSTERDRIKITELAEKYVKRGKIQNAISEYQKLLQGDAQDISVRNILIDLFIKLNRKDKAIEEFHKIAGFYEERGLFSQSIAIYKKINRLSPGDTQSAMKLAELYSNQGFLSEAKAEYLKIAEGLRKDNLIKESIVVYERLLKLDRKDVKARLTLAELYAKLGLVEEAIERFNDAAEFKIRNNALKEASTILDRARALKRDHPRTLTNLIGLLKRENKKKEAFSLITDILKKEKDNVKALTLMGDFYFDDKEFKKAEEIFSKVVSLRPKDVEARVKLGQISIYQDDLDKAFELYEPLVDILIKKKKIEKAIGLLGLILSSKKIHLPTLEGLAAIYKSNNKKKNLEIVYRVILEEYNKINLQKESLSILKELIELCPEDKELKNEYSLLSKEFGPAEEEEEIEVREEKRTAEEVEPMAAEEAKREAAEEASLKAEEEARRKAEEAKLKAEEEEKKRIEEEAKRETAEEASLKAEEEVRRKAEEAKLKAAEEVKKKIEEEAKRKAEEVKLKAEEEVRRKAEEEKKAEKKVEKPSEPLEGFDEMLENNMAQAELYIEQGLVRNARRILENLRIKYPNESRIEQRIKSLSDVSFQVKEEDILQRIEEVSEKESKLFKKKAPSPEEEKEREKRELSSADSISESAKGMEKNLLVKDYEQHFNLGFSFLEEGSIDRAIEEFKLASKDKNRSLECYNMISKCYQEKEDFQGAAKWVKKALEFTEEGTDKFLALTYELASIFEELEEMAKALALYEEINEWNSGYREVGKKVKVLKMNL